MNIFVMKGGDFIYIENGYRNVSRSQGIGYTVVSYVGKNKDRRDMYQVIFDGTGHAAICEDRSILNGICVDRDLYKGQIYTNHQGERYKVLDVDVARSRPTKRRHFIIFDGYDNILSRLDQDIKAGKCENPYKKTVCGIGCVGEYDYNIAYSKYAKSSWDSMIKRCYHPEHIGYKNYGAKGVFVCDRWLTFSNYIEDIPKLRGWDEELYTKHLLTVDKDKYSDGVSRYAPEVCCLLSRGDNSRESCAKYVVTMEDGMVFNCGGNDLPKYTDFSKDWTLELLRKNGYSYKFKRCKVERIFGK